MKRLFFLNLVLIFLITACATQTKVDINPLEISKNETREKILILPFTIYEGLDFKSWEKLNIVLYEAFKGNFLTSFFTIPFEEVLIELSREGKLELKGPSKIKISSTLLELYQEDWSPQMKEELQTLVAAEIRRQRGKDQHNGPLLRLQADDIFSLGRHFGARYVLRGRVVECTLQQEETLNPFKIGFLTAQNRILSRFFYGAPQNRNFGIAQEVSIGGILAAIAGSNAKDPFHPPHKEIYHVGHPLFGETFTREVGGDDDYDLLNALSWGAAGALISYFATHGGEAPEVAVYISVELYDLQNEEIIWENRVRLRVSPQSVWAPRQGRQLILVAIEKAANFLASQMSKDLGLVSMGTN